MPLRPHTLDLLPESLALCRLPPDAPVPEWAGSPPFSSVTRTAAELSIVCAADAVPAEVVRAAPWRALRVAGPLDLGEIGVLAALAAPLAAAGVSVFAIATYDTDYLLVPAGAVATAVGALRRAGYAVRDRTDPAT